MLTEAAVLHRKWEYVLTFALDMGKAMLENGGEVHRVEDTIQRICHAYGAVRTEVFSIVSLVTATVEDAEGRHHSQSRRVYSASNNMDKLERLNALSRIICHEKPDPSTICPRLYHLLSVDRISRGSKLLGGALAAGGFTVFFGGNYWDGLVAAILGLLITLLDIYAQERLTQAAKICLHSFLAGFLTLLLKEIGLVELDDKVMIGIVMLLIPGISFGNALREMLKGDTATGILRLSQSIILAGFIAIGFALAHVLGRILL